MTEVLRIWTPCLVAVFLSLYLYEQGARRVYDIIFSAIAIVITSPICACLAAASAIKKKRVFVKHDGKLEFACGGRLAPLAELYLVFIGKKNILPERLKDLRLP